MIIPTEYAHGARLRLPTPLQIKATQVVPRAAASDLNAKLWDQWEWDAWIKPQIDLSKNLGANCIKLTGANDAIILGQNQDKIRSQMRRFLDYCQSRDLLVYYSGGSASKSPSDMTVYSNAVALQAAVCEQYPNVVGYDVWNECNLFGAPANPGILNGYLSTIMSAVRAVTGLPLTASLSCPSAEYFTDSWASTVASHVDFMDFHPYFVTGHPVGSDWATYRAQSWYKPWIIGECGKEESAGQSVQAARWAAVGVAGAEPDCYGALGFSVTDYDTLNFGIYAADLTTERPWIANEFRAWPARV